MDLIDRALVKLPRELKWNVMSYLTNPHGFHYVAKDGFDIDKYGVYLEYVLSENDDYGNTMLRELFLKQWASAEYPKVCGLEKRKMVLHVERFFMTRKEEHEEEVLPSCGEYYMNSYDLL